MEEVFSFDRCHAMCREGEITIVDPKR